MAWGKKERLHSVQYLINMELDLRVVSWNTGYLLFPAVLVHNAVVMYTLLNGEGTCLLHANTVDLELKYSMFCEQQLMKICFSDKIE